MGWALLVAASAVPDRSLVFLLLVSLVGQQKQQIRFSDTSANPECRGIIAGSAQAAPWWAGPCW